MHVLTHERHDDREALTWFNSLSESCNPTYLNVLYLLLVVDNPPSSLLDLYTQINMCIRLCIARQIKFNESNIQMAFNGKVVS